MRIVCAALLLSLIALAAPSVAAADSLEIVTSADVTEDVTFQLSARGTTTSSRVFVSIKATGGRGCAANAAADDGEFVSDQWFVQDGFERSRNLTEDNSGTYLVCAWLSATDTSVPTATVSQVLTVRAPRSSVVPNPPREVGARGYFPLQTVLQTELSRRVFEAINPPGIPCGANWSSNRAGSIVLSSLFNAGGPFTVTTNTTAPAVPGTHTICAYVQEESSDTVPEAVGSAPLVVFSQRCRKAQTDVGIFAARVASLTKLLARPTSLRRGSKGARVKKVQKRLGVKQTGNYTRATVRSVKRFQRRRGLKRTGIVDAKTAKKMRLKLFDSTATRRTWKRDLAAAAKSQKGSQQAISRYCL